MISIKANANLLVMMKSESINNTFRLLFGTILFGQSTRRFYFIVHFFYEASDEVLKLLVQGLCPLVVALDRSFCLKILLMGHSSANCESLDRENASRNGH
jgi:hypothetical protein